jgi:parallel beta-helix repeat protein
VHDNFNEIFSWVGTKTFVHAKIDEGKGISLQRNQEFKNGGRMLVANNIAFWNGYSGIHSQDGDNIDMFSNTAYMNSYTNTRGEYKDDGDARGGNNIGVSLQGGEDVRIANNVAYIDTSWRGMPVSIANEKGDTVVANNLVFGEGSAPLKLDADYERLAVGTIVADPMFELESDETVESDALSPSSFRPMTDSPAIGAAAARWTPCEDFFGNRRSPGLQSVGAVEVNCEDGARGVERVLIVRLEDFAQCYAVDEDAPASDVYAPPQSPPPQSPPQQSPPPPPTEDKPEGKPTKQEKAAARKARQKERREKRRRQRQARRARRLSKLGDVFAAATSDPVGQLTLSIAAIAAAMGFATVFARRRARVVAEVAPLGCASHSEYGAVV